MVGYKVTREKTENNDTRQYTIYPVTDWGVSNKKEKELTLGVGWGVGESVGLAVVGFAVVGGFVGTGADVGCRLNDGTI